MVVSIFRSIGHFITKLRHKVGVIFGSTRPLATTNRFPGPGDFAGSYDGRATDAWNGGQSTYNGSISVILLDRALVQNALPGDFRLAQRADGGSTHPVIQLIGHQRDLMLLLNGVLEPWGLPDYEEMMLLIPFVVRASGQKWHNFVLRMYLDDLVAVGLGDAVYAYAKVPAEIVESGTPQNLTSLVTVLLQGDVFGDTVTLTGPWDTSDNVTLAGWSDLQEIFEMPLVGADVAFGNIMQTVCSYWEWDYTNAEVAPASSQLQFLQPPSAGTNSWVQLGQLSSDPNGTFAIRGLRWRMAGVPPACVF
jgi:hypothetical protein